MSTNTDRLIMELQGVAPTKTLDLSSLYYNEITDILMSAVTESVTDAWKRGIITPRGLAELMRSVSVDEDELQRTLSGDRPWDYDEIAALVIAGCLANLRANLESALEEALRQRMEEVGER